MGKLGKSQEFLQGNSGKFREIQGNSENFWEFLGISGFSY
jgi:hypothetical protein